MVRISHNIEQSADGRAAFVAVRDGGWHQLGTVVDHDISVAEGLRLAHLADLDYHMEPVYADVNGARVEGEFMASVRKHPFEAGTWQMLGAGMSQGFTLHPPEEAFAFGEEIIEAGQPLAALGSINNGRRAFAAFRADDITVGGVDQVRMFLNVMTAFDGSMSTVVRVSAIRVVCSNTFTAVLSQGSAPTYRVRHMGAGLEHRVDEARAALKIGWQGMETFQAQMEALLDREVSDKQFASIVETLLPVKDDDTDRIKASTMLNRGLVHGLYDGATVANIRGTAWGALNAATEFYDWTAGRFDSSESRMVAQITPGSRIDDRRLRASRVVAQAVGLSVS